MRKLTIKNLSKIVSQEKADLSRRQPSIKIKTQKAKIRFVKMNLVSVRDLHRGQNRPIEDLNRAEDREPQGEKESI